jgi:hypothetical protein
MELGESIPDDELREMVDEADRDQDGFVVFEDFYRIMKKPSDDDVSGGPWGGGLSIAFFIPLQATFLPLPSASHLPTLHTLSHPPFDTQDDEDD